MSVEVLFQLFLELQLRWTENYRKINRLIFTSSLGRTISLTLCGRWWSARQCCPSCDQHVPEPCLGYPPLLEKRWLRYLIATSRGTEHPDVWWWKPLSGAERNYDLWHKKRLRVLWVVLLLPSYLQGEHSKFRTIITCCTGFRALQMYQIS